MFKFKGLKTTEVKMTPAQMFMNESIDKVISFHTNLCYDKEKCTRKLKRHKKHCLMFCKRISD